MKILYTFLTTTLLFLFCSINAQIIISSDPGDTPDQSAILEVKSNAKGFLRPQMTTLQRDAIVSPASGLTLWCTDCGFYGEMLTYNGYAWVNNAGNPATAVWICGDNFIDPRDQKTYGTLQIGDQCWMAENLNVGIRIDGTVNQSNNAILEKYCYSNNESNCNTYGGLYQWAEMMKYINGTSNTESPDPFPVGAVQGICPVGWHIPSDGEWTALTNYIKSLPEYRCNDILNNIAKSMAATTNWNSSTTTCAVGNNRAINNASGLTFLPGGVRNSAGFFNVLNGFGYWWTSSESSPSVALYRDIGSANSTVGANSMGKETGRSVRCLKN